MPGKKYRKLLTIILIIGIIAILGLVGYFGYDMYKKYNLEKGSEDAIAEFENLISEGNVVEISKEKPENEFITNNTIEEQQQEQQPTPTQTPTYTTKKTTYSYKNFVMIGYIEIPKTKVKYPIVQDTTLQAYETAIVYLYGPGLNQTGNSLIVGHNYKNGLFFSNNKKLANGDKIYITDGTGAKMTYTIYNKYDTTEEDVSYLQRDTADRKEITLSTCTDNLKGRTIIWAKAD